MSEVQFEDKVTANSHAKDASLVVIIKDRQGRPVDFRVLGGNNPSKEK